MIYVVCCSSCNVPDDRHSKVTVPLFDCCFTDVCRLTAGILSAKCVVRRFRRCANVIQCTYTNLDNIAYYKPRLYVIAYSS